MECDLGTEGAGYSDVGLRQAIDKKQQLVDTQRQLEQKKEQVRLIGEEQNRIRENMKTVRQPSPYYDRLVTKLNDQESQIEKLQTERDKLRETLNQQRGDLENYLNNTTIG